MRHSVFPAHVDPVAPGDPASRTMHSDTDHLLAGMEGLI